MRRASSFPLMFALGLVLLVAMGASILFFPVPRPETAQPVKVSSGPSNVAWTPAAVEAATSGDVVRGMVIARRCEKCHGEEGFSDEGTIPNLASMDRLAFWKQMEDFRSAHRASPIMQPQASVLTSRDEADLAAYYAMLPAIPDPQDARVNPPAKLDAATTQLASRLVTLGDGARGVPPCQACHGPVGNVRGAPSLATQNSAYVSSQLDNFADGSRANDINLPMRTVAAQLTQEERKALGQYYGAGLGELPGAANPIWKK